MKQKPKKTMEIIPIIVANRESSALPDTNKPPKKTKAPAATKSNNSFVLLKGISILSFIVFIQS